MALLYSHPDWFYSHFIITLAGRVIRRQKITIYCGSVSFLFQKKNFYMETDESMCVWACIS